MNQPQPQPNKSIANYPTSNNHHHNRDISSPDFKIYSDRQADSVSTRTNAISSSSTPMWGGFIALFTILIWLGGLAYGFQTALTIQSVFNFFLAVLGIFIPGLGVIAIGMLAGLNAIASELILTGGLLRFNTLNYWLLIVMAISLPFLVRLKDLTSRVLQLFIVVLVIGLIYSKNISEGMDDILNIITTFGLVYYLSRGLKDEICFYWLGITNGILGAFVGFLFFLQFQSLPYTNPNNWTYLQLASLFSICIGLYYSNILKKSKVILLLLAVVNFSWIFLSGSRGSLLIALICFGYIFLTTKSLSLNSILIGLLVLVGIWISTRFIEQQVSAISRIQLLFNANESESRRTSQRSQLFLAGLELFKNNPLGIGTGSFREASAQTGYVQHRRPAHSAWIKTLVENGIQGAFILVLFVTSFTISSFRNQKSGNILLGLFITAVFGAAFIAKEFQEKSLWLLAAMGIVIINSDEIRKIIDRNLKRNFRRNRRLGEIRLVGSKDN